MNDVFTAAFLKSVQTVYTELNMRRLEAMLRDNPMPLDGETDEEFFQRMRETYFGAKKEATL